MSIEILNNPSVKDWIIHKLAARKASRGGSFTLCLSDEKIKDLEEAKEILNKLGFVCHIGRKTWLNPETKIYEEVEDRHVTFSGPSL